MSTHAAFLRGMNLGRRRITNEELSAAFANLGFADARAFRASGNVIFSAAGTEGGELEERIAGGLAEALGYPVETFVRSAAEVGEIAARVPFADIPAGWTGKLQVGLLLDPPSPAAAKLVDGIAGEGDLVTLGERELYWLPSGPMSDSELNMKAIEGALGAITIRTMGTIEAIAAKHFADAPAGG